MTSNAPALLRSYIIYGICLPLAVVLGYLLTSGDIWTLIITGLVVFVLAIPFLLKWHHPVLVLSWNMSLSLFFLPGRPDLWMLMTLLSLGITILQGTISKGTQIPIVWTVMWPLIFLAVTLVITAKLTGGIGIRSFGSSELYGGKRYVMIFGAMMAYFALASRAIPQERALRYLGFYFLGGITTFIGTTIGYVSPKLYFLYLFFPVEHLPGDASNDAYTYRSYGVAAASAAVVFYMMGRYGIRGVLDGRRPWRAAIFALFSFLSLLGGFRSSLIILLMTFFFQFYWERLYRTRLLALVSVMAVVVGSLAMAVAPELPHSVQRTMAFIPWVDIDPVVRMDAEGSTEWRINMWRDVLPQVPEHLLLGKGYALTAQDLADAQMDASSGFGEGQLASTVTAGDYHNGPLSVIMPMGIWGVIGFLWFVIAGIRVLYSNYRNGPPELQIINTFLLASFVTRIVFFLTVFGSFYSDMLPLLGLIGLSISFNAGVCRHSASEVTSPEPAPDFRSFRGPRPALAR